jgi:hypothetical protein
LHSDWREWKWAWRRKDEQTTWSFNSFWHYSFFIIILFILLAQLSLSHFLYFLMSSYHDEANSPMDILWDLSTWIQFVGEEYFFYPFK